MAELPGRGGAGRLGGRAAALAGVRLHGNDLLLGGGPGLHGLAVGGQAGQAGCVGVRAPAGPSGGLAAAPAGQAGLRTGLDQAAQAGLGARARAGLTTAQYTVHRSLAGLAQRQKFNILQIMTLSSPSRDCLYGNQPCVANSAENSKPVLLHVP